MRERNEFLETIGNNVVGKGEVWALRREKGKEGKRKKKKRTERTAAQRWRNAQVEL